MCGRLNSERSRWDGILEELTLDIPPGFTTVFPYIFARDAATYLAFLEAGLGGEISARIESVDGVVRNAQVRFNDTTVMVSEETPPSLSGMRSTFYLYVENADAAMARALSAGGVVQSPVKDQVYGERQGGVRDPAGNIWWLSQRTAPGPYA
jgi:uncharacterized glyoxalase superfamily protein PhnB